MPNLKIYCKNYDCPYNKKLEEPYQFKFSQIYTPFEDDKCKGECSSKVYNFDMFNISKSDFVYELSECVNAIEEEEEPGGCYRTDCMYNEAGCERSEILVDKHLSTDKWVCKCYALPKIRGHMDWFGRFLNNDGTAKGGNIDDRDAEKMNKWTKTTRSYRTHMKQAE
jgi:hypothetical protein